MNVKKHTWCNFQRKLFCFVCIWAWSKLSQSVLFNEDFREWHAFFHFSTAYEKRWAEFESKACMSHTLSSWVHVLFKHIYYRILILFIYAWPQSFHSFRKIQAAIIVGCWWCLLEIKLNSFSSLIWFINCMDLDLDNVIFCTFCTHTWSLDQIWIHCLHIFTYVHSVIVIAKYSIAQSSGWEIYSFSLHKESVVYWLFLHTY